MKFLPVKSFFSGRDAEYRTGSRSPSHKMPRKSSTRTTAARSSSGLSRVVGDLDAHSHCPLCCLCCLPSLGVGCRTRLELTFMICTCTSFERVLRRGSSGSRDTVKSSGVQSRIAAENTTTYREPNGGTESGRGIVCSSRDVFNVFMYSTLSRTRLGQEPVERSFAHCRTSPIYTRGCGNVQLSGRLAEP